MEVIVVGTHEYDWALRMFARQFDRYWGGPVTYWGDREPEGEFAGDFHYRQVPCFAEGVWPWSHHFGRGLKSILAEVEDVVAIFLPDHWICEKVDKRKINGLARYVVTYPTLRANLTAGTCLDAHGERLRDWWGMEIVSVRPDHPHCSFGGGVTFAPALWDRERLRLLLEDHWNLWAAEKLGTDKFARSGLYPAVRSVGTRPALVRRAHGLYHELPGKVDFEGLDDEDREVLRGMLPAGWRER